VLYVGGGIMRGPSAELRARRATGARRHDADGARRVPRLAPAAPRHAGHARHGARRARAAGGRPARRARRPFDDRVTGKATLFAPNAKVVHVDIDPAEISKIRTADVPIVGGVREVITDLEAAFRGLTGGAKGDIESGGPTSTACAPSSRSATRRPRTA
jgi:acetolactate synthase-1/2/3 large subunit